MYKDNFKKGDRVKFINSISDMYGELRDFGYNSNNIDYIKEKKEFLLIEENKYYKDDDYVWFMHENNNPYPFKAKWMELAAPRETGHPLTKMFKFEKV